jgi:hypothetical protein
LGQELGHNPEVGSAFPETSDSPNSQAVSIYDLSFIIHPSHEPTSEKNSNDDNAYMSTPESSSGADEPFMLTLACNALDNIMTQLTKFMMYQHAVFGGGHRAHVQVIPASGKKMQSPPGDHNGARTPEPDPEGLSRYIEAADAVLMIVTRSTDDHIKYVNPFLSSTIWLAAAVQLVYKFFAPLGTNTRLTESKSEVLRLNYTQFVEYWRTICKPSEEFGIVRKCSGTLSFTF